MSAVSRRWFAFVTVEDKAGASTALTGVFSERGVSFGSISTLDVHGGIGTLSVAFSASDRLAQVLVRTLARHSVVRDVTLVAADDARLRGIATLTGGSGDHALPADAEVHRYGDGARAITIVVGPLPAVEEAVAVLRASGCTVESVTALPPAEPA